ncbi:hypothetical protein RHSIM_Rhsim07G0060300 [Rhododendron simsii]|uniref:Rx N-terminal domain-containing protein n=1 Tax=Rhododendron simsii TaxID=118357 RepID=A0A834GNJ9_RHOSS|nr:hypothetical protein RHSIM_Rhsim07G0060300 [Rhododendron simsii]
MAGEALLGAAFGVLLDRLTSPELINLFRGRKHDERLLKKLKVKLLGLNKVLNDAENQQFTDRAVKEWLDELKGAVYDAEDLVDEIATEVLRCKVEAEYQSSSNHVQSLISSFTKLFDDEIESKLEKMIGTLEDFAKEKDVLGVLEKPKNNKTVEEEGYECFRELLSRSFFQRSNANDSLYVMDDLVHDLAQYVMGDFCYRLEDDNPNGIAKKVRFFSFVPSKFCSFEKFKEIREAKCLRTFLPFKHRDIDGEWLSKKVVDEILPRLTRLRLMSLSEYGITQLPHSIGNLIHLRFLDLSRTRIRELPESVCTLYNLETLLLSNCHFLTTLPADLVKLVSLRHLDLSKTNLKEMPMHIGRLKDLRQLTVFILGKCTRINELGEFRFLCGTISISGLQNVQSSKDALEAKMSKKKYLEKLALKWDSTIDDSQNARDVLEKLEPHTNLKHLEIKNYGGTRFPTWLGDQSYGNMVSLHLEDCENCFSLPPLGQMASLKELTIERMSQITSVDREFYGESGSLRKPFQSLETLHFENMLGWENWCILGDGEFSRLQKLVVIECPELIGGLPKMSSLVRLEIKECPKLVASLPNTTSIRELALSECQGMQLQWQGVSSIEKLEISGFASLKEFPSELVTLTNLKELRVDKCSSLYVPLSEGLSHCNMFLDMLQLDSCESLKSLPLGLFPKLRSLGIRNCTNFETLLIPDGVELQNLTLVEELTIQGCNNMLFFPCGGLPAPNLSSLWVQGCKKLKALPEQMHTLLPSLQSLGLQDCPEIESFPDGGLPSNLDFLHVNNCKKLKALPEQMHTLLPSLQSLGLQDCPEIESFPRGGLPSKLRFLSIWNCKKLVGGRRDWGLRTLPSLKTFSLYGESEGVLESFPEEGLLPSTLTSLRFGDMPNLKSLNERGLQLLGSLECMLIFDCPQLQSLSEERLPTSLSELGIRDCPLLKGRCRREEGGDWHRIAHIPHIYIDGQVISE